MWPIASSWESARCNSPAKQSSSQRNPRRDASVGFCLTASVAAAMASESLPAWYNSLAFMSGSSLLCVRVGSSRWENVFTEPAHRTSIRWLP